MVAQREGMLWILKARVGAIVAAALLAAGALVLVISWHHSRPDELNRSVEVLLSERLGLGYRIVKESLNPAETDQSGVWWVVVDERSLQQVGAINNSGLMPADQADTEYYRKMINDQLGGRAPIGESQLLRGEVALGRGSICETLACDIDLLIHPDGRTLFVSISKI